MRLFSVAAVLALVLGVSGCSKCDVPTWSIAGFLAPAACGSQTPGR